MRDLNKEFADTDTRKYAYEFDFVLRKYMLKTFAPFFKAGGTALEMGCYKGDFTKELAKRFAKVSVIEGSKDLMAEARKNVPDAHVDFQNSYFEAAKIAQTF